MLPSRLRPARPISLVQWLSRLIELAGANPVLDNLTPLTEHYLEGWSVEHAYDWLALRHGAEAILDEWLADEVAHAQD